jgi:hypothetical protein
MTGALTIARHLAQLQVYVAQLRELQQHSRADLDRDWRIRATVDRTLQLAIEVVISVCDQLIAGLSLPLPDSGRDAVLTVARAGVISDDPGARLARAWLAFVTFWCISPCRLIMIASTRCCSTNVLRLNNFSVRSGRSLMHRICHDNAAMMPFRLV